MTEEVKAAGVLKAIALERGLPDTEVALFGVRCPYCGKMDRIRPLEPPEEIDESVLEADAGRYRDTWAILRKGEEGLGICWFCRNILRLQEEMSRAEAILP